MNKSTLLILGFLMTAIVAMSQSRVNFQQQMATPTYFFPELAGWHGGLQVATQYRNQWPGIPHTFVSYNVNVDGYSNKLHSGFAFNAIHDRFSTGLINNNRIEFSWSPKVVATSGLIIMPALSLQYSNTSIDWSQLTINSIPIYIDPTQMPMSQNVGYLSLGGGLGIIYKEAFGVVHVHDINQPNMSFYFASESRVPRMYSTTIGRIFTLNNFKLTPSLAYHYSGMLNTAILNFNAQYKWIYIGTQYRHNNTLGFAVGAEWDCLRFSYSYDITTSRLGNQTLGSHELAMRIWLFKDKVKKQFLSNLPLM